MNPGYHVEFIKIDLIIAAAVVSSYQFNLEPNLFLMVTGLTFLGVSILNANKYITANSLNEMEFDHYISEDITQFANFAALVTFGFAYFVGESALSSTNTLSITLVYYILPYFTIGMLLWKNPNWNHYEDNEERGNKREILQEFIESGVMMLALTITVTAILS